MNNTLCSAAWSDINLNFATRTIRHCCRSLDIPFPKVLTVDFFNNSSSIRKTRKDLINGIETANCITCWEDYKLAGNAYRDFKNEWKSISDVSGEIKFIEIFLDNLCDMSCVYCDEIASSKIASERKVNNPKNPNIDNDLAVFVLFLEKLTETQTDINLSFLGGEVTYSKKFFYFVEQLLQNEKLIKSKIHFSILTNCNSSDAAMIKTIALFNKMPNNWYINVSISNESIGSDAELVRYGLSWDRFINNFKVYYSHKKISSILLAPALTIFTVKTFPDFIKTMINIAVGLGNYKQLRVFGNWVVYPKVLNPAYAKSEYKQSIRELKQHVISTGVITNNDFMTFLDTMIDRVGSDSVNIDELDEFLESISKQKSDNNIWKLKDLL